MDSKSQKTIQSFAELSPEVKKVRTSLKNIVFEDISSIQNTSFKVTYMSTKKPTIVKCSDKGSQSTKSSQ